MDSHLIRGVTADADSEKSGARMRAINSLQDVQIVLKELTDWKDNMISKAFDRRGLQIKNMGDAVDPTDAVTLRQLKPSAVTVNKKQAPPTVAGGGAVPGAGEFSFQAEGVFKNPGIPVAVNHFSVDLTQNQRVNFCYTPQPVVSNNLIVNIIISSDLGNTFSVLDTLTVPVGSEISWPSGNPPINQSKPYSGASRILQAGDLLNFTIENGAATGLTIKLDTRV